MQSTGHNQSNAFQPIEDESLRDALGALGRLINIASTYGAEHPAFKNSLSSALESMQALFKQRKKVTVGAFNGEMTIDEIPVNAAGTLLKSLERHLVRLHITSLRLTRGISESELTRLAELLAHNDANNINAKISASDLTHIATEAARLQAVQEGQIVANESDLAGARGSDGVLILDDELSDAESGVNESQESTVHVEQIVAFLNGDLDLDDSQVSEEFAELASDPARLGQMIMESVAIRQSAGELSGESLSDVILGCLRRTYDGLRKQPAFKTTEGPADLQKALLLLEEGMLEKMRNLTGEEDPEMDRQIIQSIREMNDNLNFEMSANQYVEYQEGIATTEQQLKDYVRSKGENAAGELISNTDFPSSEWRRIVVDSREAGRSDSAPPIAAGLNTLTRVLEKLEHLMKSEAPDGDQLEHLLGQANDNLGNTTYSTKEKLDSLSKQLYDLEEDTGTVGGQAREMDRKELLSSIAEIAQELMQPLTAMNASIEMLLSGYVGEVAPDQRNLLSLASSSGDDLNYLMQELIKIVGIPINRGVDKRFAIHHKKAC